MRQIPVFLAALLSASIAIAADTDGTNTIDAALANPARNQADRERDARDQPKALLEFAGFGQGMRIADIFGGGGYYSEILDRVVGADGKVLLINNPAYDAYARKDLV